MSGSQKTATNQSAKLSNSRVYNNNTGAPQSLGGAYFRKMCHMQSGLESTVFKTNNLCLKPGSAIHWLCDGGMYSPFLVLDSGE